MGGVHDFTSGLPEKELAGKILRSGDGCLFAGNMVPDAGAGGRRT